MIKTIKHVIKRVDGYRITIENKENMRQATDRLDELKRLCVVDVAAYLSLYKESMLYESEDFDKMQREYLEKLVEKVTSLVLYAEASETYRALGYMKSKSH